MKITSKMILLGTAVCYLLLLAGCGGTPADKDVSVKEMSKQPAGQPKITKKESAIAVLEEITKASPDKPGVTRVVMTLDQKASYSTSREGDRLIINIFNARMKSSIKELEVRDDPVVASITAKQIGNSVKSIVKLVEPDVAYTPSTSTDPFQIFVDVWKLSAQAGVKPQSRSTSEQATVPKPLKSIDIETSPSQSTVLSDDSSRTKDVVVDTRPTPEEPSATPTPAEQVTSVSATPPSSEDVPAQLQWFSEKLSQVLQEKERLKQDLLEAEKSFTVKDSMIEVLERKLKEANARIVELEEELIKVKSNMSLAEQRQTDAQDEMYQLLAQLEEVVSGKVTTVVGALSPEQIRQRADQLITKISAKISNLEQQGASLNKTQQELSELQAQVASLTKERDDLQNRLEASTAEMNALRQRASRLAEVEKELRTKELELSRLRRAIGAAAQLVVEEPRPSDRATVPRTTPKPAVIPEPQTGTTAPSDVVQPSQPSPSLGPAATEEDQSDAQRMLADLLQQQQVAGQSTNPADYVLGPDDVVSITVEDEENLDKTVTVSPDGFINYPLLGDLRVDGLTLAQLDAQITSLLARDFLVDPEVLVELVKQRSKKVYIMGLVKQPGYHELEGDQTLLSALLSAGGPSSFQTEARVLRLPKGGDMMDDSSSMESFAPIVVDLNSLFVEGDQSQNIVLRDGDVVMVASTKTTSTAEGGADASELGPDQFYVVGSVAKPGIYTYKENDTVLDAVLRAGGFTEFASRNNTKLVRETSDGKTRTFRIKMKDIMEKGEMDKNMPIRAGDMIIVPESFF